MGCGDDPGDVVQHDQGDAVSDHADTIRSFFMDRYGTDSYKVNQRTLAAIPGSHRRNPPRPHTSAGRALASLDALLAENQRLADRAVCSGCGGDVDEGGACHYTDCAGGEMIPASDLPGALLALNDERQEERLEWRFDWEALRAEAKGLEAENQLLRDALEDIAKIAPPLLERMAREALAGDADD